MGLFGNNKQKAKNEVIEECSYEESSINNNNVDKYVRKRNRNNHESIQSRREEAESSMGAARTGGNAGAGGNSNVGGNSNMGGNAGNQEKKETAMQRSSKPVSKRQFIITKRKKPVRFKDLNLNSLEYEFTEDEKNATIFESMTEVMSMLDRMCKNGDIGIWYREIVVPGDVDEHLYVFVLNSKTKRYVGFNRQQNTLFLTSNIQSAHRCKKLKDILEFGLEYIPTETLNELQIIDLKEAESAKTGVYLFGRDDVALDKWELLGDDEAFKKFADIIEFKVENGQESDIFKREVLKLLGARKYLIDREEESNKTYTKNALIQLFSKMIEIRAEKEDLLYIEWFIRTKLMMAEEVRWIVRTKWFGNALNFLNNRFGNS